MLCLACHERDLAYVSLLPYYQLSRQADIAESFDNDRTVFDSNFQRQTEFLTHRVFNRLVFKTFDLRNHCGTYI